MSRWPADLRGKSLIGGGEGVRDCDDGRDSGDGEGEQDCDDERDSGDSILMMRSGDSCRTRLMLRCWGSGISKS